MEIVKLDPRDCIRWKYADRSSFEFGDISILAEDIKRNGQIQPIHVRPLIDDPKYKYEVIAGSRRLQACFTANLMIDAIVTNVSDDKAATIQIKENEQIPLSEYSKGIAFSKLKEANALTQEQLAEIVGCSRKKIRLLLAFAKVDQSIWNAVSNMSRVSAKSAEVIMTIANKSDAHKETLIEIAEEIRKGAGHRRITAMVDNILNGEIKGAEDEIVTSVSGQTVAKWKNGTLCFAKDLELDKQKFNQMLIDYFKDQTESKVRFN